MSNAAVECNENLFDRRHGVKSVYIYIYSNNNMCTVMSIHYKITAIS